ncbi:unnamed protein product [Polarella glacialis]|uniref:Uncharacterized protein n=1 Tax=Polarella glacialis TaxID=89957 RepID=A0A813JAT9_POLGL|nr:unnamed protein product [Polarella glacialis]
MAVPLPSVGPAVSSRSAAAPRLPVCGRVDFRTTREFIPLKESDESKSEESRLPTASASREEKAPELQMLARVVLDDFWCPFRPSRSTFDLQKGGSSGARLSESEGHGSWAECLLQFADAASPADASEVWVFRKKDYQEFQRLIGLRLSYRRPSRDTEPGPQKFGEARREEAMAGTTVTCRERNVDPSLVCAECIKVFTGGAYRDAGIAVPAFPPAPDVMQCLALSVGEVFKANGEDPNDSKSVIEGPRVGHGQSPLRQAAFCNYVNARFSTVPSES